MDDDPTVPGKISSLTTLFRYEHQLLHRYPDGGLVTMPDIVVTRRPGYTDAQVRALIEAGFAATAETVLSRDPRAVLDWLEDFFRNDLGEHQLPGLEARRGKVYGR